MRRIATAVTLALLGLAGVSAWAQTSPTPLPEIVVTARPDVVTVRRPPGSVVVRLLSFDADGDDRVTAAELPERMQSVVDRVDQDDDGFMTAAEIEAAVDRRPAGVEARAILLRNRSTSSLSDVVQDLKLPQPKHDLALAIVKNYQVPRNLNNSKSLDLEVVHTAMKELLDEEEFADFMAAAARISPRTFNVITTGDQIRVFPDQPGR
jgi:hypothetical protein